MQKTHLLPVFAALGLIVSPEGTTAQTRTITGSIRPNSSIECSGVADKCFCQRPSGAPFKPYHLDLTLTLPFLDHASPVIIFFHGQGQNQLNTGDYLPYSQAAYDRGFAFVEYDVTVDESIVAVPDVIELQFFPAVMTWLEELNEQPGTPARGKLDLKRSAVAGHSRGGKLAALHFASGEADLFAAYLIEPVECPCFAPCSSDCYPPAIPKLKAQGKSFGVSIAETTGCCNPHDGDKCGLLCQTACYAATGNGTCIGSNAQDFLDAGANGSLGHTRNAGHLQFADEQNTVLATLGNLFCGYNSAKTSKEVSTTAAVDMMDWFESELPAYAT